MAEIVGGFAISIDQVDGYEFRVNFHREKLGPLIIDEPAPLGKETGPTPTKLLVSSIASCLCASLLFCANKSRINVRNLHAEVKVQTIRNDRKRLRIGKVEVEIDGEVDEADRVKVQRCVDLFEEYCTVTQSVRDGIDIRTTVKGFQRAKGSSAGTPPL